MNRKFLKFILLNVQNNKILTDMSLENNKNFDILFIQEPSWLIICSILSFISEEKYIIGVLHYLL